MAKYSYVIPVRVHAEEYLESIEEELSEIMKTQMKVEEILRDTSRVPFKIRKEVLELLSLPPHINLAYEITNHDRTHEFEAIPRECEDLAFDIS